MFKIGIVIVALCLIKVSQCSSKLLKCSTMEFPSRCPPDTICSQITALVTPGTNDDDGECQCKLENYEFNVDHKGINDYCIHTDARNRVPGSDNINSDDDDDSPAAASARQRLPSSHHIISGILISICLVCVFILIVIIMKKLRIRQRFREFQMNQRNRPLYEDVQLAADADDPPLI